MIKPAFRYGAHARPIKSYSELGLSPHRDADVLVRVVVRGNAGPHRGRVEGVLPSGRVRCAVNFLGTPLRVITEPINVYPLMRGEGSYR